MPAIPGAGAWELAVTPGLCGDLQPAPGTKAAGIAMLMSGVVVLGVTDRQRAGQFWSAAPDIRPGTGRPAAGSGCWSRRRGQAGSVLALQTS